MKYFRPVTLDHLFEYLQECQGGQYLFLAGGTDLMTRFESGQQLPQHLIDLKKLEPLFGIQRRSQELEIGALTPLETIKQNSLIQQYFPALHQSTLDFAGVQIRHRATLGGNICNASPAADTLPPLYAHSAAVKIIGPEGERRLPLAEFITGSGQIDLQAGELVQSVVLPLEGLDAIFYKLGLRSAMAIAVINFAVVYDYDRSAGRFRQLRISAGAVAPTVVHLSSVVQGLLSEGLTPAEAIQLVDRDISPIDDLRASAAYRRSALQNTLEYVLEGIIGKR